jgi:hypothetical protein
MNATSKLVKAWESKNAKNAARAGGVSLMALSLAACGGSSETATTPVDLTTDNAKAILDAVTAVDAGALTVQEVADRAEDAGMKLEAQATIDAVNALIGANYTTSDTVETVLKDVRDSDNADLVLETLTANGITYESLETALSSITASVATQSVVDYKASTEYTTAISSAETAAVNAFKAGADYATAISDAGTAAVNAFKAGADYAQALETAKLSNDESIATQAVVDFKAGTEYATAISSAETAAVNAYKLGTDFAEAMSNAKTAAVDAAIDEVDAVATTVGEVATNAVDAAIDAVDTSATTVAEVATNAVDAAIDAVDTNATTVGEVATNAVDAAIDAVDTNATTVAEVATNAVDTAMTDAGTTTAGVAADITQLNNFLDAQARTLDTDNETINLASSTSNIIIVHGEGAGADSLDGTVVTADSGTVVFDFTDAADTVVLSADSSFAGVTDIDIQGGTVDFTALDTGALTGINITAASGATMTGAQLLEAGALSDGSGGTFDLTVNIGAGDDAGLIIAKLTSAGLTGDLVVTAPDGKLTPAQTTSLTDTLGGTVTNPEGGSVVSSNAAPTMATAAETTEITDSGVGNALTASATVADTEGNWNGGTITITPETGFLIGDDSAGSAGLTIAGNLAAGVNGAENSYSIVAGNVQATDADGAAVFVGTVASNGAATVGGQTTHTSLAITLNENATTTIVNELLTEIQFAGVVNGDGVDEEANITVTIADAAGGSTSFTRQVDSDGAEGLSNMSDDDRELEAAAFTAGVNIDGGNATLNNDVTAATNDGINLDGAVMTIESSVSTDSISVVSGTYSIVSGVLLDNGTAIGTVTGNGTASVTVTFNSSADNANGAAANVDEILQGMTVSGSGNGAHVITTSIRDAGNDASATDTATLTVVGDFQTVTLSDLATADSTADPSTAVEIDQNTVVTIGNADAGVLGTDLDAQIAADNIVVTGSNLIRVDVTGAADISSMVGLHNLGSVSLNSATGNVTMTTAQAVGFGEVSVAGGIIVTDLESNTAADLSNITSTGGAETASIDTDGDVEFTGDLGNFALTVNDTIAGTGTLTIAASVADGKSITANANETVVVSGVTSSDAYDLSGISDAAGAGSVVVNFNADTTLAAASNLGATGADIDVEKDVTLTLTAAQADGLTIDGDQAVGDNTAGGSIAVTDLDATLAADLSSLTAGTANAGAIGTSAGSITASFGADGTFTGDLGAAIVTVNADATMTAAETVVTGKTIVGDGAVVVEGAANGNNFDLSTISTSSLTYSVAADLDITGDTVDLGTATVSVENDATLTINASDITGLTATGVAADDGATGGSLVVTMDAATALDLSSISAGSAVDTDEDGNLGTAGSLTANIADGTALHATTDLGEFALVLGDDADLAMTAAQAAGRSIDGTAVGNTETLSIDVSSAASDLDISGIGANIDTTTLTSSGSVNLSSMTLDASVGTVTIEDGDADAVSTVTVTMTVAQADAMNTELGTDVVTIANATNNNGAADDTVSLVVTADADNVAGVTYVASSGADTLGGTGGADSITGGTGADVINGGAGADTLLAGGAGDDEINGGAGADTITGGDGADTIDGGDDADTITGGAGADTMTGGDGDDDFVIAIAYDNSGGGNDVDFASADSGIGAARDIITDFADAGIAGGDTITLDDTGYDSDGNAGDEDVTYSFIGTSQFAGNVGEVRYTVIGGNSIIEIDADGDSATDLQIQVNNVDVLATSDFVL